MQVDFDGYCSPISSQHCSFIPNKNMPTCSMLCTCWWTVDYGICLDIKNLKKTVISAFWWSTHPRLAQHLVMRAASIELQKKQSQLTPLATARSLRASARRLVWPVRRLRSPLRHVLFNSAESLHESLSQRYNRLSLACDTCNDFRDTGRARSWLDSCFDPSSTMSSVSDGGGSGFFGSCSGFSGSCSGFSGSGSGFSGSGCFKPLRGSRNTSSPMSSDTVLSVSSAPPCTFKRCDVWQTACCWRSWDLRFDVFDVCSGLAATIDLIKAWILAIVANTMSRVSAWCPVLSRWSRNAADSSHEDRHSVSRAPLEDSPAAVRFRRQFLSLRVRPIPFSGGKRANTVRYMTQKRPTSDHSSDQTILGSDEVPPVPRREFCV